MVYGLDDCEALARVCYHAQELSLLASASVVDKKEMQIVKSALDDAYRSMFSRESIEHAN